MKEKIFIAMLLWIPILTYSQDLELGVHVLPTSVLGDPAMFNIIVRNMDEEPAEGVEVQIELKKGLKALSFTPDKLEYNPESGRWLIGKVERHRAAVLTIIANYVSKDDAILMAEITKCRELIRTVHRAMGWIPMVKAKLFTTRGMKMMGMRLKTDLFIKA